MWNISRIDFKMALSNQNMQSQVSDTIRYFASKQNFRVKTNSDLQLLTCINNTAECMKKLQKRHCVAIIPVVSNLPNKFDFELI